MLISILYDNDGQIITAAATCDVPANDTSFWRKQLSLPISNQSIGEVGQHEIQDRQLIEALIDLQNDPTNLSEVQQMWDRFQTQPHTDHDHSASAPNTCRFPVGTKPGSKIVIPKAA